MHSDNSDRIAHSGEINALPAIGPIRLIALHTVDHAHRRVAARRRIVAAFAIERRHGDRRRAKPGIDGLLRTVLADGWM